MLRPLRGPSVDNLCSGVVYSTAEGHGVASLGELHTRSRAAVARPAPSRLSAGVDLRTWVPRFFFFFSFFLFLMRIRN